MEEKSGPLKYSGSMTCMRPHSSSITFSNNTGRDHDECECEYIGYEWRARVGLG